MLNRFAYQQASRGSRMIAVRDALEVPQSPPARISDGNDRKFVLNMEEKVAPAVRQQAIFVAS